MKKKKGAGDPCLRELREITQTNMSVAVYMWMQRRRVKENNLRKNWKRKERIVTEAMILHGNLTGIEALSKKESDSALSYNERYLIHRYLRGLHGVMLGKINLQLVSLSCVQSSRSPDHFNNPPARVCIPRRRRDAI